MLPSIRSFPWDEKTIEWTGKKFIKGKVLTLFYMPLNFGSVIVSLMKKIRVAGATAPDNMVLSDHASMWNMDLFLAVDKEIPGAENITLSGSFLTKAYEGDFKNTEKWCKEFEEFAKSKGVSVSKQYMRYTTCPGCAKKYGKNYVVIVGKLN